jgi:acetyl esterase/lipase
VSCALTERIVPPARGAVSDSLQHPRAESSSIVEERKDPMRLAWAALFCCGLQEGGAEIEIQADLAYGQAGGETLRLDLARPKAGKGPFPAIVCIHGGGWSAGSRRDAAPVALELARRGYVAAAVGYRLAPKHRWPAQIEDVKRAVRWLRANAAKHRIDPERIGAVGVSAGAHLAALLGTTTPKEKLEGPGDEGQSSRVRAVVAWAGPYDFVAGLDGLVRQEPVQGQTAGTLVAQFLGGSPSDAAEKYRTASPTTHATKDDAPFLLIHGGADRLVPMEQAELFEKALKAAGVEVELRRYPSAGHGLEGADLLDALTASLDFFEKKLKAAARKGSP